jgi:hypothetical protein
MPKRRLRKEFLDESQSNIGGVRMGEEACQCIPLVLVGVHARYIDR